MINFSSSFIQGFLDVALGEAVSEVPAEGELDDLGRESVASEG